MQKVIDKNKLEKVLISRWADFLDQKKVIAFTMSCVRDNKDKLQINEEPELPNKSVQIMLSQFKLVQFGFDLWIDFTVPTENELCVGTLEAFLSNTGVLRMKKIMGYKFIKQHQAT